MESHFFSNIEESAMIILNFQDNITCYAFESWMAPVGGKRRDLVVIGNKMSARIDYLKPQELQIFDSAILPKEKDSNDFELEQEGSYTIPIEYKEPLKEELRNFVEFAQGKSKPLSDMYSGKRAVEMIDFAFQSAKSGNRVSL
jgi:predicted dehydrogenase